ncbi:MAG: hypothetical protein FJ309_03610 [Planctomycetes bacterium]|nr:hypothetical protein [Planctomycetota bacterium]MBM4013255.1 hypothetical protein [Planctomycetota bacterium]
MSVIDATRIALNLDMLALPASLRVKRLEVQEYTDTDGEPALRILAVIDDAVDVEHVSGGDVSNMKSAIRESLRRGGIRQFAYVFIAKQSELDDDDGEER